MAEPELEPGELAELVDDRVRDPAPRPDCQSQRAPRARSGSRPAGARPATRRPRHTRARRRRRSRRIAGTPSRSCTRASDGPPRSARTRARSRPGGRDATTPGPRSSSGRRGTGIARATVRGTAALTFENSVAWKRQLLARARGAGRAASARTGSRGRTARAVGRRRGGAGGRTRRRRRPARGGGREPREPVLVVRDGVLRGEDDEVARREPDPEVAGAPVAELLGRDLVDECAALPRALERSRPVEPESTTTTSTGSSTTWRAIASRQRTRSAPPSLTGMTTEITGARRRAGTGTRRARGARPRRRGRRAPRRRPERAAPARCGRARRPGSRRPRPSRRGSRG